jgi:hypothetical protein
MDLLFLPAPRIEAESSGRQAEINGSFAVR